MNIFKDQKEGFYLDIGCGHPIKKITLTLLNKKVERINIDLDVDNIDLFKFYRKKEHNLANRSF